MATPWDYTTPHVNPTVAQQFGYVPSSDYLGPVVFPTRKLVKLESPTMASSSARASHASGFRLSTLSPSQVERASFTPHTSVIVPPTPELSDAVTMDAPFPPETEPPNEPANTASALEKALSKLSVLESRLAEQEVHIRELEEKFRQCQEIAFHSFSTSTPAQDNPAPLFDLLDTTDESSSDCPPNNKANQDMVNFPPLVSTPNTVDDTPSSAFNHLADFEGLFERKGHQMTQASENKATEMPQTLLEGIGSPAELTHHRKIDSRSHLDANLRLDMGDNPPPNAASSIFSLSSDSEGEASDSFVLRTPLPWNGKISWTPDFAFEDSKDATGIRGQQEDDVVYKPRARDVNIYRTVAVLGLPADIDMKTFLKGIRGGNVYCAHLHNTLYLCGSHTGIVTFIYQNHAVAYTRFASRNGVYFNGKRAKVVLFQTPTYPFSETMEREIFYLKYTRCLTIRGESDPERFSMVVKFLKDNLRMYFDLGERMVRNTTDTEIIVQFNSIQAAGAALEKLRKFPLLDECDIEFGRDPCSEPLPGAKKSN